MKSLPDDLIEIVEKPPHKSNRSLDTHLFLHLKAVAEYVSHHAIFGPMYIFYHFLYAKIHILKLVDLSENKINCCFPHFFYQLYE